MTGVPVVAEPAPSALPAVVPTRQAAVLAATGFVAGAAVAVLGRHRPRVLARRRRRKPKGVVGEIVGSNAFLVEVHLLRRD